MELQQAAKRFGAFRGKTRGQANVFILEFALFCEKMSKISGIGNNMNFLKRFFHFIGDLKPYYLPSQILRGVLEIVCNGMNFPEYK